MRPFRSTASFPVAHVFLSCLLLSGATTACREAEDEPTDLAVRSRLAFERVTFERREESPIPAPDEVEAEEGTLREPLRHDDPGADSIEIHLVRFPSTSTDPGPPIVYLAGGPGGSGTRSAGGDRFGLFHALREVGDVIALDQRGTAGADPFTVCPGSWDQPLDEPTDVGALSAAVAPFLEACWRTWSDSTDLTAFNTLQSAEDLDDLREALGADEIVLWGISYGTHLGLAYIRRHPDRVERAILAGVEGPDHTWKLPSNLDRVLMRVDSAVRADPEARRIVPDLAGGLRDVVERLEREPARVEVTDGETGETHRVTLGPRDVQRALFGMLGEREDIVQLVRRAAPVLDGDYSQLARSLYEDRRGNRALAMSLSMDCASGRSPARSRRIEEESEDATLDDVGNMLLRAACPHWPVPDLGEAFRSPVRADMPVLFISGTLDARTPPSNAREVAEGFPRSHHLVIEGGSHDDDLFLSSPGILETMLRFLRGEEDELPGRIRLPPLRFERR